MRIKKGDVVVVTTGKNKPNHGTYTTGEVLAVYPATNRVLVNTNNQIINKEPETKKGSSCWKPTEAKDYG